ncbi:ABC transporter substrate-binding protein [Oscillospiraceae bacterium LTW-04]|nr:ABC transporter substrate-binding protein [Oscillospiraceae bacterium MB24-C1]
MKKLISIVMAISMLLSLVACGSSSASQGSASGSSNTDAESEPTKIIFWYSWSDKIQENNENLVKQFNETVGKEKGIEVTAEYQGTYDDLHQKLQAAYVSGTTPAVTVMEIASIKTFAENGVLEPLSPYIKRDGIDMNDFYEGLLENCKVSDTWYGLPYLRSTPILYMNTTLLKQAGLDLNGPKTWDELAEYCKTIKEKTGAYGLSMYSYIWTFEAFMLENGSSILSDDEMTTNINTNEAKFALQFFKDLKDKGYIRCVAGTDSSKVDADYMNQNCAMWMTSTANLSKAIAVAKENNFEVNTCYIPKNTDYGVPTGGCNLIMTTKISDKEKEAAWEFIKWMTATEQSSYASEYTGYVTSRKSATATERIQNLYKTTPQFKVALDQLESSGHGRPMNPGYAQSSNELVAVMDAIWVNGADIATTVADAETKINKYLKK